MILLSHFSDYFHQFEIVSYLMAAIEIWAHLSHASIILEA